MVRLVRGLLEHPLRSFILLMVPTLYFGVSSITLELDTSNDAMFDPKDPEMDYYRNFMNDFGSDENLSIFFEDPNLFSLSTLRLIDRLTKSFQQMDGVESVVSLTNVKQIYNEGESLVIESIEEELPTLTEEGMPVLRERLLSDPFVARLGLISKNYSATGAALFLEKRSEPHRLVKIVRGMRKILSQEGASGIQFWIGGSPFGQAVLEEMFFQDMKVVAPLMTFMVAFVLIFVFRRFLYAAFPLWVIGITGIWTFGGIAAMGWRLASISEFVLPLLVVYGVLDAVFFLNDYRNRIQGMERRQAILATVGAVWKPCFYTSLTTLLGFASLSLSSVAVVRDFGLYSAYGVLVCFLMTFIVLPLCLDRFPVSRISPAIPSSSIVLKFLGGVQRGVISHRTSILIGIGVFLALCVYGIRDVVVDTDPMKLFQPDAEVVHSEAEGRRLFGAWAPLEFSLEVMGEGSFEDPVLLKEIEKLQQYLESLSSIGRSTSIVDLLKKARQEIFGGNPSDAVLPPNSKEVQRLLGILENFGANREVRMFLREDAKRARMTANSYLLSSRQHAVLFQEIQAWVQDHISPRLEVHLTGHIQLGALLLDRILFTEIQSFSCAFLLISICLWFAFRSWRLALIAIPPNLFPVIVILGVMGKMGISLNVGTCTVASIVIGMAVDNTIHFLHRFREEMQASPCYETALLNTVQVVGPPMVYTSLVLAGGFFILTLSTFVPAMNFGFLSGVAVLGALVGDVVILPALLLWLKPISVEAKEVVAVSDSSFSEEVEA
ncbi:MAG: MMPL family transporter [Deltaproteobacteria bacterium]|nr:MMPL family transporter [Deltaproteobacteria bacterium]